MSDVNQQQQQPNDNRPQESVNVRGNPSLQDQENRYNLRRRVILPSREERPSAPPRAAPIRRSTRRRAQPRRPLEPILEEPDIVGDNPDEPTRRSSQQRRAGEVNLSFYSPILPEPVRESSRRIIKHRNEPPQYLRQQRRPAPSAPRSGPSLFDPQGPGAIKAPPPKSTRVLHKLPRL
ncbi:uncharacterized protein [Diabrotica undecimpunctata]|uniref:uncharacterized protein n=1 Tax=Diabrotica undecimpunctata TaxID=50387 RepID=UPI003B632CF4